MAASAPGDGALELRGVCKRYGTGTGGQVTAADRVSFTIEAGAFVALTGASGSGKSTMLHLIGTIERPDSGVITVNGTEVTALRGAALADYRRTVGFVFQRYNLLPGLTALDNIIAPVLPYRTGWDKRDRARGLLAAVGLAGRERSLPARMSGGEQQRIAIARAVVARPDLLIADEPTGNVDPEMGARLIRLIAELNRLGTTVLIATHDRALIEATRAREMRLIEGRLVELRPTT
jgi:putative ABC transport system ATP-binding protein